VTTAALGAGVDFPASQVIFDALAMGRNWLSVQEFNQMAGRAGRPDFHDLGKVVLLAEPGGSYSRENPGTEEEIALKLLKGRDGRRWRRSTTLKQVLRSTWQTRLPAAGRKRILPGLMRRWWEAWSRCSPSSFPTNSCAGKGTKLVLSPLARVMSEHFIGIERLLEVVRLTKKMDEPLDIIAELECPAMEKEEQEKKGGGGRSQPQHGHHKGHGRR